MKPLLTICSLLVLIAWWQKDTLDDRAQTNTSVAAPWIQQAVATWSSITPPSPSKAWIAWRDAQLDAWFVPSPPPAAAAPSSPAPKDTPVSSVQSLRKDPPLLADKPHEPAPIAANPTAPPIRRILIAGDSMSGDVGLSLRQLAFQYKKDPGQDVHIIDAHRHSTGLVVSSYYHWPVELRAAVEKNAPQAIVFMVGANDGQAMRLADKTWVKPGTPAWQSEYTRRADEITDITKSSTLVWLDLPSMRSADLQQRTAQVNPAIAQSLEDCRHCVYVKTRDFFGGDTYNESMRSKDGVHYNRSGANHVASEIWKALGLTQPADTPRS